jgi:rubrerythrin
MKRFTITIAFLIVALFASQSFAEGNAGKTIKDLKDAFTGETTASAKYAAYAKKARDDGHASIAVLFEAASRAEKIHASNHAAVLTQLGEKAPAVNPKFDVKSTKENLEDAIAGETYESKTMYPGFLKDAKEEKAAKATISFNYAYKTELRHKALYESALKALKDKTDGKLATTYWVCPVCGNTYDGEPPARCGFCMTAKEKFVSFK